MLQRLFDVNHALLRILQDFKNALARHPCYTKFCRINWGVWGIRENRLIDRDVDWKSSGALRRHDWHLVLNGLEPSFFLIADSLNTGKSKLNFAHWNQTPGNDEI